MLSWAPVLGQGPVQITARKSEIILPGIRNKSPLNWQLPACSASYPPRKELSSTINLPRRLLLSLGLGFSLAGTFPTSLAVAARLRSLACDQPSVVTFTNTLLEQTIKLYWLNYDGDEELFAILPPGQRLTIDTFETHPWRIVDAQSGQILKQYTASRGIHTLELNPKDLETLNTSSGKASLNNNWEASNNNKGGRNSSNRNKVNKNIESTSSLVDSLDQGRGAGPSSTSFEGFDGVGGQEDEYAQAQVAEIALDHLGGVALLEVEGFNTLIPLPVAALEAAQLFHASGIEFRRPTTVVVWVRSLQAAGIEIKRSLVTRVVGTTYYGRIVLRLPNGDYQSVDARPSDAISVAMASKAEMYVAKKLAAAQQPGSIENMLGMYKETEPPVGRVIPPFIQGIIPPRESPGGVPGERRTVPSV